MAWITPTGKLYLLKGIPLDTTYEHTIYFATPSAQQAYFLDANKIAYSFTNLTYQRVNRDKIRVQALADNLYSCNYMVFQNAAYGDKYFYAFIKEINYINDIASEIVYEIDVMQTWNFNYILEESIVERQHSVTDNIGDNIIPEPVNVGEYVYNGWDVLTNFSSDMLIILATTELEEEWSEGKIYDGVYGGLTLYAYHMNEITQLNAKIATLIQQPDAIQMIYMIPNIFLYESLTDFKVPENHQNLPYPASASRLLGTETIDGHTPKNKKLYTYPYNFYHVDNNSGKGLDLRYEFFLNNTPTFSIYGTITQPVKLVLRPTNYKNTKAQTQHMDYTQSLTIENFPQCSWNIDAYWAWVAQHAVPELGKLATGLMGNIVSILSGGFSGGLLRETGKAGAKTSGSFMGAGTSSVMANYQASIQADICKGNQVGNVNVASGYQDYFGTRVSVNEQFAKIIDDFFTKYGYAQNRLMIPNVHARPRWTYVKTVGCVLSAHPTNGGLPCDDERTICEIYDKGITFWRYGVNNFKVGDYTGDNSPSS